MRSRSFFVFPGRHWTTTCASKIWKKAILHRKNAYFFKTQRGAEVGDIYMSLIRTAELSGISPFNYLCALMLNTERVIARPHDWLPWNYHLVLIPTV